MDPSKPNFEGAPFNTPRSFNAAMYTSIGRAKSLVVMSVPTVSYNSITDATITSSADDLTPDIEANKRAIATYLDEAESIAVALGQKVAATPTSTAPTSTTPVVEEEQEYEDDGVVEEDATKATLPLFEQITPVPLAPQPISRPTTTGDKYIHQLAYPANNLTEVPPNTEAFIIPVTATNQ